MTTILSSVAPGAARSVLRNRILLGALAGLFCSGLSACSGGEAGEATGGGGGSSPDGGVSDAGPGDSSVLVGSFQVRLVAPVPASNGTPETPGYTAVLGKVYDGPTPATILWEEAAAEGACRLLTPKVPFCSTPCGGSAACVADEKCQDYPLAHGAGKVTVTGLHPASGVASFTMEPVANNYQLPASVKLPYPASNEGEAITFAASGDYFSAFTVSAKGIGPLVLADKAIALESGKPAQLAWTPPEQAGIATIHVKLDISHHGGTKGMIACDTEDTGALELPALLVTKLLDLGVAGFPTIVVTRQASGSATLAPGRVDLVVSSTIEREVQIAGLNSCTSDADCPTGQTCQADLTCK